ncbi:nucleotidyltransferase domain-containing protein [Streptomyces xiamenensis]
MRTTTEERRRVRELLLRRAEHDPDITAAALTGSAARGEEDAWSDIDLLLGVAAGVPVAGVVARWSTYLYGALGAVHHFDLRPGEAVYRAFLLPGGLEADLGFTPRDAFGRVGDGGFLALWGEPAAPRPGAGVDIAHLAGLGWHHLLHARIAIARARPWQAEHWIGAARGHVLTLAAYRLGLPSSYAKGADRLPPEITTPLLASLTPDLSDRSLTRALAAVRDALLTELHHHDPALAATLAPEL